jgi:hypothetical protein
MAGTLAPFVFFQALDDDGDPLPGALLFSYAAGTSTKQATYSDVDLTTPNTNPIVLDAAGRAVIYLGAGAYKFVLAPADDSDPPAAPLITQDNVSAVPQATSDVELDGIIGENVTANDCLYLSSGLDSKTAGYWYKTDATDLWSSVTAEAVGFAVVTATAGNSIAIRTRGWMDEFSGLTAGSVYYIDATTPGALTDTAPTNARPVGVADSPTGLVIDTVPLIVFPRTPKTIIGTTASILRTFPVVLQSGYSGLGTTTPLVAIPAGTLATNGDQIVCEWHTEYSSATLSARVTWEGANKDFGTGGNTTKTAAKAVFTRTSNTALQVDLCGSQDAVAMTSSSTLTSLDLAANPYGLSMSMASGTYVITSYRVTYYPTA